MSEGLRTLFLAGVMSIAPMATQTQTTAPTTQTAQKDIRLQASELVRDYNTYLATARYIKAVDTPDYKPGIQHTREDAITILKEVETRSDALRKALNGKVLDIWGPSGIITLDGRVDGHLRLANHLLCTQTSAHQALANVPHVEPVNPSALGCQPYVPMMPPRDLKP